MPYISEDKARILWEKSVVGLAFVDKDGTWLQVNPALCELLEYSEVELQKMKFTDLTHPGDVDADWVMAREVLAGEIPYYVMMKRYITKTNNIVTTKLRVDRIEDNQGNFVHFLSQVAPAEIVEIGKPNAPAMLTEEDVALENVVFTFLKKNWKLVGGALISITFSVLGFYTEYKELKKTLADQVALTVNIQASQTQLAEINQKNIQLIEDGRIEREAMKAILVDIQEAVKKKE